MIEPTLSSVEGSPNGWYSTRRTDPSGGGPELFFGIWRDSCYAERLGSKYHDPSTIKYDPDVLRPRQTGEVCHSNPPTTNRLPARDPFLEPSSMSLKVPQAGGPQLFKDGYKVGEINKWWSAT